MDETQDVYAVRADGLKGARSGDDVAEGEAGGGGSDGLWVRRWLWACSWQRGLVIRERGGRSLPQRAPRSPPPPVLHEPALGQARVPVVGDDQVVVDRDAHDLPRLDELAGHGHVLPAGFWVARGVIMG